MLKTDKPPAQLTTSSSTKVKEMEGGGLYSPLKDAPESPAHTPSASAKDSAMLLRVLVLGMLGAFILGASLSVGAAVALSRAGVLSSDNGGCHLGRYYNNVTHSHGRSLLAAPTDRQILWKLPTQPGQIYVSKGSSVTWRWVDGLVHTVNGQGNAAGLINGDGNTPGTGEAKNRVRGPGFTLTRKFDSLGDFDFQCGVHGPRMRGRVTVVEDVPATCDAASAFPNQCFNADGSRFTCCPAGCGPPGEEPVCEVPADLANAPGTLAPPTDRLFVWQLPIAVGQIFVTKGSKVTWRFNDARTHTVNGLDAAAALINGDGNIPGTGEFKNRVAQQGFTVERKFDNLGDFPFQCGVHGPQMSGLVTVVETERRTCDSSGAFPNQCFNGDGSQFTCCPAGCGLTVDNVPLCARPA